ncbi:MAG: pantoate--beta-alanine ligase [Gammaproteobacteria bacterium]|nr:pantoate--beta-alanine ligase [Gammaproteobacteria bacterium]
MEIFHTIEAYRSSLNWRRGSRQLALLATRGDLHDGHIALIKACRDQADINVVSICSNPLLPEQLGAPLAPPIDQDVRRLENLADCIFAPAHEELFPFGLTDYTGVRLPVLADELSGPQHADVVEAEATMMLKLLLIIQPNILFYGEKNYRQLVVTERMIEEFSLDIRVVRTPILRDFDGVALGNGLQHLLPDQRKNAPIVHQTLNDLAHAISNGARNYNKLEQTARVAMRGGSLETDYVTIRDADTLQAPTEKSTCLRIMAAAKLGQMRIVDNIGVDL